ncbi:MAG: MBL fold metallo-hydrolase [Clostridia bacterium]|nr:MBL fold metallo-hydrolase [Clostridia bacterium]
MVINIHRGQNQIGGSIIEISDDKTRLFFDIGVNLDESENKTIPQIEGLFCGEQNCDGVFISHYHADHIGLADKLLPKTPIFIGEKAYNIMKSAADYRNKILGFTPQFIYHKEKIKIGNFTITAYLCDHSAFDSYMFIIENDGKKVLYTGDFRANGRLDFDNLLYELPEVDAIIIEGTTLSREDAKENIQEEKLETIAIDYIRNKKGPIFVMMSAQNIDRLVTMQNVADKTNRTFLQDIYTAEIARSVGKLSEKARVFLTKGGNIQYQKLICFNEQKIGKHAISQIPFIMCIRQSMRNYLETLHKIISFDDGVLFYGMWKGYMEQPEMKEFLDFMTSKGVKIHTLHTSGHADVHTIDKLINDTKPKMIIPVHTENSEWFEKYSKVAIISNKKSLQL